MPETALERRVAELVDPMLAGMGYELVRVRMSGGGRRTLQIMAERADRAAMTVDDCADISRAVSALIDVEDPISGTYELEVSSPGIDRPLVRPQDFVRFAGYEAKIEMRSPIDGRRRFRGRLLGLADDRVRMALAEGGDEVELAVDMIEKAKLVVTDALITGDLHAAEAR